MHINHQINLWEIRTDYLHTDYWLPLLFNTPANSGLRDELLCALAS